MPLKKRPAKKNARSGRFDQGKEVRAIARERVGSVKPSRVIPPKPGTPKTARKPKHKKLPDREQWEPEAE